MTPELQKALTGILTLLKDGAAYAAAAGKQELPLLVQEYLRWGLAEAATYGILCASAFVMCLVACRKSYNYGLTVETAETPAGAFALGLGFIGCVFFGVNVIAYGMTVAKILIAPRVYLLDAVSKLVP